MNDLLPQMKVINVFVNENGEFGNPVGIIVDDERKITNEERQQLCKQSGFSEIVFINNAKDCNISIFSPTREIPFAGHAVIGTVAYLDALNKVETTKITSLGTVITARHENGVIWVQANLQTMPKWNFKEMQTPEEVDSLTLETTKDYEHCYTWSWVNQNAGMVRARTFAPDWLIPEDEANGSGSLLLAHTLQQSLIITHGKGALIYANYIDESTGEIGGKVKEIN